METDTKYLGIDYGERRVGIAVTDGNKKYSFSRDHIENNSNFFVNLLKLIKEENIIKIILGYPLNFKSEKTIQTIKTEEFKTAFEEFLNKNSIKLEIIFFDERFTSKIAESGILNSGMKMKKRRQKGLTDSISAQIILQDYIDKTHNLANKIKL
ncbi:MAG TPA: Holliday junction resolvase RuvX [Ignavibacteria bacterium]|nr:Holliday junction resolvase RuvX [Ignavibacteria bacterium]